jgi:hypothetical protein
LPVESIRFFEIRQVGAGSCSNLGRYLEESVLASEDPLERLPGFSIPSRAEAGARGDASPDLVVRPGGLNSNNY